MSYELHPLCTLFPRVDGAEFDALVADVKANGLRQPIVLHDGMILDGGNRYRACVEAGVKPSFVKFDGDNLVSFVLSANLHRRHLSTGQQAAIVASAQDWAKAQTHGGYRKADQGATLHLETAKSRASESGANLRTQVSGLAEPMMIQAATAASCSIGSMASLSPIAPSSLRNVRNSGLPDDESIR